MLVHEVASGSHVAEMEYSWPAAGRGAAPVARREASPRAGSPAAVFRRLVAGRRWQSSTCSAPATPDHRDATPARRTCTPSGGRRSGNLVHVQRPPCSQVSHSDGSLPPLHHRIGSTWPDRERDRFSSRTIDFGAAAGSARTAMPLSVQSFCRQPTTGATPCTPLDHQVGPTPTPSLAASRGYASVSSQAAALRRNTLPPRTRAVTRPP